MSLRSFSCFIQDLPKGLSCNGLHLCRHSSHVIFFAHHSRQIVNCLNEWVLGYEVKIPFAGDRYESVYKAMLTLIDEIDVNEYHGAKLEALPQCIASDGWLVAF